MEWTEDHEAILNKVMADVKKGDYRLWNYLFNPVQVKTRPHTVRRKLVKHGRNKLHLWD